MLSRQHRHTLQLGNIRLNSGNLRQTRTHAATFKYTCACSVTLGNTGTHSNESRQTQIHSSMLKHTPNTFGHTRQHSNTLQHSEQHSHLFGSIQANWAIRQHAGTHTDIHDNTRMHSITQGTLARSPIHSDTHAGKNRHTRTRSTLGRHARAEAHWRNTECCCLSAATEIGVCFGVYVRARVYFCWSVSV